MKIIKYRTGQEIGDYRCDICPRGEPTGAKHELDITYFTLRLRLCDRHFRQLRDELAELALITGGKK